VNCSTHPIFKIEHNEQSLVPFAQKNNMDNAKYCRLQAQECRRLLRLPQSEAAAQVLKNLCHSWIRLANQADLYAGIVRRQSSSTDNKTDSLGDLAPSPARGRVPTSHHSSVPLRQGGKNRGL
jgi:hypothetical protein